jgi:hypothetical protein
MMIIGVDYHPSFQQIRGKRSSSSSFNRSCASWRSVFCFLARDMDRRSSRDQYQTSGYRVRRIGIYGNCCGTGIGWCRCAHES